MATIPLSIVIVGGAGSIGPRHAAAIQKCSSATLFGIVDPSPAAQAVADTFGVPLYQSVAQLISQSPSKPDAALVCTPNQTHVSLSHELLSANIHVLVEKPLCTSIPDGRALISHAESNNLVLVVGHHRRLHPCITATKRALDSNSIGRVIAVSGLWMTKKSDSYFLPPMAWHADAAQGGGATPINLIHEIDILHHLFGPISRVYAEKASSTRDNSADEGAAIVLRFASGVVATFLLSDATPSGHLFESGTGENPMIPKSGCDFYRVFGTKGVLSVPDLVVSSAEDWTREVKRKVVEEIEEGQVPFELQIERFVGVVRGVDTPSCSARDGLAAVVVCEAVLKSMRDGLPVDISD